MFETMHVKTNVEPHFVTWPVGYHRFIGAVCLRLLGRSKDVQVGLVGHWISTPVPSTWPKDVGTLLIINVRPLGFLLICFLVVYE